MEEFMAEPFVMREPGSGTRKSIEAVFQQSGHWPCRVDVVAAVGSTEAIRQAIKAGVGISILSECAVAEELAAGSLKKLEIKGLTFKRSFYLIMAKYRSESPLCRAFVTFLKQKTKRYRNR